MRWKRRVKWNLLNIAVRAMSSMVIRSLMVTGQLLEVV
jgi:hypothetical protein